MRQALYHVVRHRSGTQAIKQPARQITCYAEVLGERASTRVRPRRGHRNKPPLPRLIYRVANMRNRASTSLSKGVSSIASPARRPSTQLLTSTLFRKSVNHGANITCITCNDSARQLPRTERSSSKNGLPRLLRAPTTASKSARASGSACFRSASAASSR